MKHMLAFVIVSSFHACDQKAPPPAHARPVVFPVSGRCSGDLTLEAAPEKLTAVPVRLQVKGCALSSAEIAVDMPGMPMNVAPVALAVSAEERIGHLVFTMSGPWRLELRLTHADGTHETQSYDLRVP